MKVEKYDVQVLLRHYLKTKLKIHGSRKKKGDIEDKCAVNELTVQQ
jgi:hypothetical protein